MRRHASTWLISATLLLTAGAAAAQDKATKEAAEKLHAQAQQEANSGKAAEMLCKAAAMAPKNGDFQSDCNGAKKAMVDADQRNLNRAFDADTAGKPDAAKHYAAMVTTLDPKLHDQAAQLLAKLDEKAKPAQPADLSGANEAKAEAAFSAGNLSAARTAAAEVTDPQFKPAATRLMGEIDRYTSLVSEGKGAETGNPNQAISSYQGALAINSHVGGDDLNGRISRLRQAVADNAKPAAPTPAQPPVAAQAKAPVVVAHNVPPVPAIKPPEVSPEEKKKKLMDAYSAAMARKDIEGAERDLREVVQLDPRDAGAQASLSGLQKQMADALNRDPVKLEKTLHDAIAAFYASQFEDAESELNRYLGADAGKKKGAAYFYLGATEEARALLEGSSKHSSRETQARDYFKQARSAGYQPVQKYVSEKILQAWQQAGM